MLGHPVYSDKKVLKVQGLSGEALANKMASFYKNRAEQLVTDSDMKKAGAPEPVLRPGGYIDTMQSVKIPKFDKLNKFIPTKKLTKTQGPSNISPKIISTFWNDIKIKLFDSINQDSMKYLLIDQGYYQRTLPKKLILKL